MLNILIHDNGTMEVMSIPAAEASVFDQRTQGPLPR